MIYLEIRFIENNEYEQSNEFYNQMHNTNRNITQWKWEFKTLNPNELPYVITKENDKVLGMQALIPVKLIDKEGVFLSAKSEETLLHPSLRGKGVLDKMYDRLFKYAEEHKMHSIWGFTGATKSFLKLGFKTPKNTAQLFLPLSSKALAVLTESNGKASGSKMKNMVLKAAITGAKMLSNLKFSAQKNIINRKDIQIKTAVNPPVEAGRICEEFINQWGGVTIYRDEEYLKWRLYDNPNIKATVKAVYMSSKLVGWIAYSVGNDYIGYIIDLIVASPDIDKSKLEYAVEALLADAVVSLKKTGALAIRGWSVNNHPFNVVVNKAAKRMGFYLINRGEPIVMKSIELKEEAKHKSIEDIDNWYITRIFTEGVNG